MILLGLGANLPHPRHGPPKATLEAALAALEAAGVRVAARSRWYASAPQPPSDQPFFVNGIALLESDLPPDRLMALLHGVEADFGRVRRRRNEARALDLDLLDYHGWVSEPGVQPALPHPRLAERAFVLLPLAALAPDWRHPVSGLSAAALAARLPPDQSAEPLP